MVHTAELRPVNPMASVLIFQGAESLDSMRQGWGYIFWPFADINRFSMIQVPNGFKCADSRNHQESNIFCSYLKYVVNRLLKQRPNMLRKKAETHYFYLFLSDSIYFFE